MGSKRRKRVVSLGRMAVFLLRSEKLEERHGEVTHRERVHSFLISTYGGYTASSGTTFGYWRDPKTGRVWYGEHREYKVSFAGKRRIPALRAFLAALSSMMGEECIYLETGEDAWLVYAHK